MFSARRPADIQRTERILSIVDPTLTGKGGHSLAYNLLLARVASPFFERIEIFADRSFRAKPHAHEYAQVHASLNLFRLHNLQARLSPLLGKLKSSQSVEPLPLDFRFEAEDRWAPVKLPFVLAKRLRALDLCRSVRRLVKARCAQNCKLHIFFQNAGIEELFCLQSLRGFLQARAHALTLHLLFRHLPERTCSRVLSLERFAQMLHQQGALGHVRMYADTEALSAAFTSLAKLPEQFKTLPVPFLLEKPPADLSHESFRLGMLGPPRMEKGFACLPTLLGVLPARLGARPLELVVQTEARGGALETRALTALLEDYAQKTAPLPAALKLCLLPGPLDATAYAACFAGLDCALALHASPKYAASSSGIFVEALHLGIPSIVFSGTWMAKLIQQAATEGLSIGLCVETLGEVPAAAERIAKNQAGFSEAISKYLLSNAWRFSPKLLVETLFGQPSGPAEATSGAQAC